MKFAYEDLSDGQFENLIVFLCQRLLGISVQGASAQAAAVAARRGREFLVNAQQEAKKSGVLQ